MEGIGNRGKYFSLDQVLDMDVFVARLLENTG